MQRGVPRLREERFDYLSPDKGYPEKYNPLLRSSITTNVILSAANASRSEALAESKDPYCYRAVGIGDSAHPP